MSIGLPSRSDSALTPLLHRLAITSVLESAAVTKDIKAINSRNAIITPLAGNCWNIWYSTCSTP
ncbi:hypothetical protein D3C77_813520 [compost metagenome]